MFTWVRNEWFGIPSGVLCPMRPLVGYQGSDAFEWIRGRPFLQWMMDNWGSLWIRGKPLAAV